MSPALDRAELRLVEGEHLAADRLVTAVRAAGFGVDERQFVLAITGMSRTARADRVERALAAVSGVIEARVNAAPGARTSATCQA